MFKAAFALGALEQSFSGALKEVSSNILETQFFWIESQFVLILLV